MNKKLLIVEDEKNIAEIIKAYCVRENLKIITAYDGEEALSMFYKWKPDILIVDIMLPKKDGISVIREIRKKSKIPLIILSAKTLFKDRLLGLESGADIYLTKPFEPLELLAYVKKLCKKTELDKEAALTEFNVNHVRLDLQTNKAEFENRYVQLTPTESKILCYLMENVGTIYSKTQILDILNDEYNEADTNTVKVHISNIREKLTRIGIRQNYITTVWGMGYVIHEES